MDEGLGRLIRGDLHCHTDASDGHAALAVMAAKAASLGREYLAITDHSPRLRIARGLSAERLEAQGREIEQLNETSKVRLLTGIEVDILADGRLDQRPALLARLDVVVASVHSELRMNEAEMTRRMVTAIANPLVDVLGHCTGQLLSGRRGKRPPSKFDAEVVFEACRRFGVAVEINSRPERTDPPDDLLLLAAELGCDFAINSDAHYPKQLGYLVNGIARAEAAGIEPERIITTWPVARLLERTHRQVGPGVGR